MLNCQGMMAREERGDGAHEDAQDAESGDQHQSADLTLLFIK